MKHDGAWETARAAFEKRMKAEEKAFGDAPAPAAAPAEEKKEEEKTS